MGLTLDELKLIRGIIIDKAIENNRLGINDGHIRIARQFLEREIKLKETDFITMTDVNGNVMDDGN